MENPQITNPSLNELLGTKNKKDQARLVQSLVGKFNAPVVDLVLRYDGRMDQLNISLVGPDISIENLYKILDVARDMLKRREFEAMKEKEDQGQPNAPAPEIKPIPTEEVNERAKNGG